MHGNKLKHRLKFVKATAPPKRAVGSVFSRRKSNSEIKEESHPNDNFDSFFDFEDDFSSQKPSRELFQETVGGEPEGIFMDDALTENDNYSSNVIIMEESENFSTNFRDTSAGNDILNDKACMFFDSDNTRCAGEKSNGSIFCSNHQLVGN